MSLALRNGSKRCRWNSKQCRPWLDCSDLGLALFTQTCLSENLGTLRCSCYLFGTLTQWSLISTAQTRLWKKTLFVYHVWSFLCLWVRPTVYRPSVMNSTSCGTQTWPCNQKSRGCCLFSPVTHSVGVSFLSIWAASWQNQQNGMCAQRRLRLAWAPTRYDQSLHYPDKESLDP